MGPARPGEASHEHEEHQEHPHEPEAGVTPEQPTGEGAGGLDLTLAGRIRPCEPDLPVAERRDEDGPDPEVGQHAGSTE